MSTLISRPSPISIQNAALRFSDPSNGPSSERCWSTGLTALHLISGRGHHFVWRMIRGSSCFERLAQIGRIPNGLQRRYAQPQFSVGECVEGDLAAAFSGLGMVMEYLAHRIKEAAAFRMQGTGSTDRDSRRTRRNEDGRSSRLTCPSMAILCKLE